MSKITPTGRVRKNKYMKEIREAFFIEKQWCFQLYSNQWLTTSSVLVFFPPGCWLIAYVCHCEIRTTQYQFAVWSGDDEQRWWKAWLRVISMRDSDSLHNSHEMCFHVQERIQSLLPIFSWIPLIIFFLRERAGSVNVRDSMVVYQDGPTSRKNIIFSTCQPSRGHDFQCVQQ